MANCSEGHTIEVEATHQQHGMDGIKKHIGSIVYLIIIVRLQPNDDDEINYLVV